MKTVFISTLLTLTTICISAQWQLTGNSDAQSTSKLGTLNSTNLNLWAGNQQRMVLKASNGFIGMNTTNPGSNLHLHGTTPANGGHNSEIPLQGSESFLQITNSETGSGSSDGLHIGLSNNSAYFTTNETNLRMYFINGAAQMSLRNEGWIDFFGASASTPARLNLHSGSNSGLLIKKTSNNGYGLKIETTTNSTANALEVGPLNNTLTVINSNGKVGIGTNAPDPLYLLDVNGKAKVGSTTTTDYALEVVGKVRACEVRVANPGWCDYVFEPDYALMPINELRNYIAAHGHLPEVPTAAQVEQSGFDLAEMNAMLLKKIEELTLYIIALDEQMKNLDKSRE